MSNEYTQCKSMKVKCEADRSMTTIIKSKREDMHMNSDDQILYRIIFRESYSAAWRNDSL